MVTNEFLVSMPVTAVNSIFINQATNKMKKLKHLA
jgi:hypothetical protein